MEKLNKYLKKYMDDKAYADVNALICRNAEEIDRDLVMTKKIQKVLTVYTILTLSKKCKSVLSQLHYPDTDIRAAIVDCYLDGKLDKQYKKPSMQNVIDFYNCAITSSVMGILHLQLIKVLGVTREDVLKGIKTSKQKESYMNLIQSLHEWKVITFSDEDFRMLYNKYGLGRALLRLHHFTNQDVAEIYKIGKGYVVEDKICNTPEKFTDDILKFVIYNRINSSIFGGYSKIIKLYDYCTQHKIMDMNTIIKALAERESLPWQYSELEKNDIYQDSNLQTMLSLTNNHSQQLGMIKKYYNIKDWRE